MVQHECVALFRWQSVQGLYQTSAAKILVRQNSGTGECLKVPLVLLAPAELAFTFHLSKRRTCDNPIDPSVEGGLSLAGDVVDL